MAGICVASQLAMQANNLWTLEFPYIFLEIITAAGTCLLIYTVCLDARISVAVSSMLLMILSVVNYFVIQFRGNEFTPMDIVAAGTALNVIGEYSLSIIAPMFYGIVIIGMIVFSAFLFRGYYKK